FQPPAYHAHVTPAPVRRSPIVGIVWLGTRWSAAVVLGWGGFTVKEGLTTAPSGGTFLSCMWAGSSGNGIETASAGAFGQLGTQAQIRKKWLRNEPPNAAWKKLSSTVYCLASS